jgi:hypothetical protein
MAELRFIMAKDRIIRTANSLILVEVVAPHASPIIRDPRFGSMNSALDIVPSYFKDLSMAFQ